MGEQRSLALALRLAALTHADAVGALIAAGYYAPDVINFAVENGADRTAMNQLAISRGVDPSTLNSATASGGDGGPGFDGRSGGDVANSRSSTYAGSGDKCRSKKSQRSSVSCS